MRIFLVAVLSLSMLLLLGAIGIFAWADRQIDKESDKALFNALGSQQTTRIYANQNLNFKEKQSKTGDYIPAEYDYVYAGENSTWVEYEHISPYLLHAFIAIEDHRFYDHDGVDWRRTGKAIFNYLGKGDRTFGGSTITQQVVKNVLGEREVSPRRKIKEIIRAIRLEQAYSKEDILTMYANIVPLANSCTGVYSASSFYFGKKPSELSLLEAASIAAITNSPSRYDPLSHPQENQKRAELILAQMNKHGYISNEMYLQALTGKITLKEGIKEDKNRKHNWFTETVLSDVIADLMKGKNMSKASATRMVYGGGLQIMSTVNPELQSQITNYFETETHFYPHSADEGRPDFALVLVDPKTGHLLATAGNTGKKTANRIQNGITTKHPPGSALKPIALYLPALDKKASTGPQPLRTCRKSYPKKVVKLFGLKIHLMPMQEEYLWQMHWLIPKIQLQ